MMPEGTVPFQRANWKLVIAAAAFVGAGLALSHTLLAGDPSGPASDAALETGDAVLQFGAGQPPEFYEQNFGRPDPNLGPVIACFSEGTDERVVAYFNTMLHIEETERYQLTGRWSGAQGTPRALTWSFVPDGLSISSGVGEAVAASDLFSRMDALFAAQGGRAAWINRFQQAFDRWAQVCGTSYTRITYNGTDWDDGAAWGSAGSAALRGDIRISMKNIDGGSGVLAYNYFPSNGDMVLDRSENWSSSTNQHRFLRNVLMHEHGHGLGVLHVCPVSSSKLMEPFLNTGYDGLRHDEIRVGQRHYGDIYEDNNTAATASIVGTLVVGTPLSLGALPPPVSGTSPTNSSTISIDANDEHDYFRFQTNGALRATITVAPQGFSYLSGPQNANGSCSAGTNINSMAACDLAVQILATDGFTVLGTANATVAGAAETLSNVDLPAAGAYFVHVFEANLPTETQLYTLSLTAAAPCPTLTIDPPALVDATVGQAFSQSLSVSGGTGPFSYAVVSGSLPAGLALSSTSGAISGTPFGPTGMAEFTIMATDSATNCVGSRFYTQFVGCPVISLAPVSLPNGKVGRPYDRTITASGAFGPYSFSVTSGGLPPGISLSTSGNLTGIPSGPTGSYPFTVTASDASGCVGSKAYSIQISEHFRVIEPF